MDKSKQIELIRKRNSNLTKQLEDLKNKLQLEQQINIDKKQRAEDLIVEIESLQTEWLGVLDDLKKKREEYQSLINDVKTMKKVLFQASLKSKIPVSQKLKMWILRYNKYKK